MLNWAKQTAHGERVHENCLKFCNKPKCVDLLASAKCVECKEKLSVIYCSFHDTEKVKRCEQCLIDYDYRQKMLERSQLVKSYPCVCYKPSKSYPKDDFRCGDCNNYFTIDQARMFFCGCKNPITVRDGVYLCHGCQLRIGKPKGYEPPPRKSISPL